VTEGEAQTLEYVRAAIASLPRELASALACPLPPLAQPPRSVLTTGVGASEGPARILAASLAEAGLAARFCPISRFVSRVGEPARSGLRAPVAPELADLLVVFSQGLSPNARLALAPEHAFGARWLVTSLDVRSDGSDNACSARKRAALHKLLARDVRAIVIPPANEPEALARFAGPTVATLMALRLAALLSADRALALCLADAPSAYRVVRPPVANLEGPLAVVSAGALPESAYAQRWKLLEALLAEDPPVWDVLQFAHGPLQAFNHRPLSLLVLESPGCADLVERLVRTLDPGCQRAIRLCASLPEPLSFFEQTAQLDALLLARLEAVPRDLFNWPGRHGDAPLYGLGEDT
jgi:creatinine amidohydrolase